VGPAVEFRIGDRFAIEASALYRRVQRFANGGYSFAPFSNDERGSAWEFPLVGRIRTERKFHGLHPFALAGPAVRRLHTRTVSNFTTTVVPPPGTPGPTFVSETSTSTTNHVSAGATAGGGLEARAGDAGRVAFELRYTRWASSGGDCSLRCAERNQIVVLFGLGF
jgi:hypothetical protein